MLVNCRLAISQTLSIRLYHFPPLTPLSRAASILSVHTDGSTQSHIRDRCSRSCLALLGTNDRCSSTGTPSKICFPVPLRSPEVMLSPGSSLLWALWLLPPSQPGDRSPCLMTLTFQPFRLQPQDSSWTGFTVTSFNRSGFLTRTEALHSLPRVLVFTMHTEARQLIPPNRVRYPTDWSFASSCSPPCLTTTQLLSATRLDDTLNETRTHPISITHRRTCADVLICTSLVEAF